MYFLRSKIYLKLIPSSSPLTPELTEKLHTLISIHGPLPQKPRPHNEPPSALGTSPAPSAVSVLLCLFVWLPCFLFVCLEHLFSVCLSVYVHNIYLFQFRLCLFVFLCVYLFVFLLVCLSMLYLITTLHLSLSVSARWTSLV